MRWRKHIICLIVFLFSPTYKLEAINKNRIWRNRFNDNEIPRRQTGIGVGYFINQYSSTGYEVTIFSDHYINEFVGLNLGHWLNLSRLEDKPFFNIGLRFYTNWVDRKISFPMGWAPTFNYLGLKEEDLFYLKGTYIGFSFTFKMGLGVDLIYNWKRLPRNRSKWQQEQEKEEVEQEAKKGGADFHYFIAVLRYDVLKIGKILKY